MAHKKTNSRILSAIDRQLGNNIGCDRSLILNLTKPQSCDMIKQKQMIQKAGKLRIVKANKKMKTF